MAQQGRLGRCPDRRRADRREHVRARAGRSALAVPHASRERGVDDRPPRAPDVAHARGRAGSRRRRRRLLSPRAQRGSTRSGTPRTSRFACSCCRRFSRPTSSSTPTRTRSRSSMREGSGCSAPSAAPTPSTGTARTRAPAGGELPLSALAWLAVAPHGVDEVRDIHRFREVAVEADGQKVLAVALHRLRGQGEDRQ